jgi:hypothetical protein
MDITREKVKFEFLDLLDEELPSGRIAAYSRPDDSTEEFRAREEVERLKHFNREHVL